MLRFIVRRLLWLIPTVLFVTFLVYCAVRIGWNPVAELHRCEPAGIRREDRSSTGRSTGSTRARRLRPRLLRVAVALRPGPRPVAAQHQGQRRGLARRCATRCSTRCGSAGTAAVIGIGIGLFFGVVAGKRPGSWIDSLVNTTAFFVGSIPPFVSAVILQLAFAVPARTGSRPPASTRRASEGFDPWLMSSTWCCRCSSSPSRPSPATPATCGRRCSTCRRPTTSAPLEPRASASGGCCVATRSATR